MSIILIGLYIYLTVKAYLVYKNKVSLIRSSKYEFLEILFLSLGFGFIFNSIYPTNLNQQKFIIDKSILWISFIASLLMLGVGIGVRFVSEVLKKYLTEESKVSEQIRLIHDYYSQIWITINLGFLAFLLSIIELSRSDSPELKIYEIISIYSLALILGSIYSFYNRSKKEIHKVVFPLFTLFGLCILLLTFENSTYYSYKAFPITNSVLIFSTSFLISTVYIFILPKTNISVFNKKVDGAILNGLESDTDANVQKKEPISKVSSTSHFVPVQDKQEPKSDKKSQSKIVNYKPKTSQNVIKVNAIKKTKEKEITKSNTKKPNSPVIKHKSKIKVQKIPAVLSLTSLKSEI